HLLKRYVKLHERVVRGQQIGTMGSNRGMYPAHLHFEMRKELRLGMDRTKWPRNNSAYYDPTSFIIAHRRLRASNRLYPIPVNTFEGQENLGTDPRLKGLQVPVNERSLRPMEERPDSGVASSTVKEILSEIQKNKESEPEEKPSSW